MSYLRFVKTGESESGLTERFGVFSESSGDRLGTIKWYGRWRQYAFYPDPETLFNPECLREIAARVYGLTRDRAAARGYVR